MGTVHLAMDVPRGRQVALKVMSAEAVGGIGVQELLKEIAWSPGSSIPTSFPSSIQGKSPDSPGT
jgi:hypothetical protein